VCKCEKSSERDARSTECLRVRERRRGEGRAGGREKDGGWEGGEQGDREAGRERKIEGEGKRKEVRDGERWERWERDRERK